MGIVITYWRQYAWALVATTGFASAYPVYHNTAGHLPASVGFTWFSLFALIASFCYPQHPTTLFSRSSATSWWRRLYPTSPWNDWIVSLRRGGWGLLGIAIAGYILQFAFLLTALRMEEPAVVVTILVIQQLAPLLNTTAAYWLLGDTCANWWAYTVGAITTIAGVLYYKSSRFTGANIVIFDIVTLLIALNIISACASRIARTKYRRDYNVDAPDVTRSTQLVAVIVGCIWMYAEGVQTIPSAASLVGLAYLGVIPTAVSGNILYRVQDIIGMPATEILSTLKPLLLIPIAWIPIRALHASHTEVLGWTHYTGIILSIVGLCLIILIARPTPVDPMKSPRH